MGKGKIMNNLASPNKLHECQYCAHYSQRGVYNVCTRGTWLSVALPYLFPNVPKVVIPNAPACGWFRLAPRQMLPRVAVAQKKWCGFFETPVVVSPHNQFGACHCLGCDTRHCAVCPEHEQHFSSLVDDACVYRYRVCQKCLEQQK